MRVVYCEVPVSNFVAYKDIFLSVHNFVNVASRKISKGLIVDGDVVIKLLCFRAYNLGGDYHLSNVPNLILHKKQRAASRAVLDFIQNHIYYFRGLTV